MPKEVQVESSIIPEKVAGNIEARVIMEHAMASAAGLTLEPGEPESMGPYDDVVTTAVEKVAV